MMTIANERLAKYLAHLGATPRRNPPPAPSKCKCRARKPRRPRCRAAAVLTAFRLAFPAAFRLACRAGRRPAWERFAAAAGGEVFVSEDDDSSTVIFADDSAVSRCGLDFRVHRRPAQIERGADSRVDFCLCE